MATRGHWKADGRGGVVADLTAVAGTLGHDLAGSLLAALGLDQPDIWGGGERSAAENGQSITASN